MSSIPPAQRLENAINEMKALLGLDKIEAAKALAGALVSAFQNVPPQPTDAQFEAMTDTQLDSYGDTLLEILPTLTPVDPDEHEGP